MSNDQLSWENLLSGEPQPAAKSDVAGEKAAANPHVEPVSDPALKAGAASPTRAKAQAKGSGESTASKSRKEPSRSRGETRAPEAAEATKLFSQDWSALDFGKTAAKPTVDAKAATADARAAATIPIGDKISDKKSDEKALVATAAKPVATPAFGSPATVKIPVQNQKMSALTKAGPALVKKSGSDDLQKPEDEPNVISVSELNRHIKDMLEGNFPLIWVKGEISNFKAHTSGHFYFSLKDSKAQISAVMFRGFNSQLKFRPEDGMEVLVRGRITVYEPRGNYQIFCEVMEPVGAGALQKAFEQLKAKLQKEGLFDQARKRPIPQLPRHIALVTSPTGAAIRDMLNVLGRRFKGARITVIPCRVQGDLAPGEIVAGIQLANRLKDVDVMIVGRGGGSIEDLWAFNEEIVARAIAASKVPTISAVGHEIDFTIADFVADLRAPTPSAAAELVVKNAADLSRRIQDLQKNLRLAMFRAAELLGHRVQGLAKRLVDPQRRLQDMALRCDELTQRLENATFRFVQDARLQIELLVEKMGTPAPRIQSARQTVAALEMRLKFGAQNTLTAKNQAIAKNAALLDSLSPLRVVQRGYSFVTRDGEIVKDVGQVRPGETVQVQFATGKAMAEIKEIIDDKPCC